jgi:putative ABC transport system permease protein
MLRNYLTVGLRALAKNKTYAFINICGLALGLAAAVLILLYVRYELSYDAWMKQADRAYQLQTYYKANGKGSEEMNLQMSGFVAGRALAKDFPQVEKLVYVWSFGPVILQDGVAKKTDHVRMVDNNLFDVLQVPFVRGVPHRALDDNNSLALSESEAIRRFGTVDVLGKTLTIVMNTGNIDYRITGVFKDFPKNSHFSANVVARFDPNTQFADRQQQMTSWNNQNGWNYVKLRPGADAAQINAQLPAWEKRNIPDDVTNGERTNPGDIEDFALVNVRDVHLGRGQRASVTPGNDLRTVTTFGVIAFMVLGMACVNFTNLATARASQRAREVALRKVLGATRRQLIAQFIGESVLVAAIAMVIALAMVELSLPIFNRFLDANIALHYFGRDSVVLYLLGLVLLVGAAGGIYPAFYLSRFEPARVLRANKSAADTQGSGRLRNVLVIGQFAVSIALIVCTIVIYAQTLYARTVDQGFNRDGLMQVDNFDYKGTSGSELRFAEAVRRVPGVQSAALTGIGVAPGNNSMTSVFLPGSTSSVQLGVYGVQNGFFQTMGMKLLAGRDFSDLRPRDDATTPFPVDLKAERALVARGVNVIVTDAAAKRLGFRTPQEAVGKNIQAGITVDEVGGLVPATIIGVVADARFRSVHDPLQPIMYVMQKNGYNLLEVRFAGVAPNVIRDRVQAVWERLLPQVPFKADFADDLIRDEYKADTARGQLFAGFAILSVVVGCLGLFGLAAFTAERRTKEIGIRKVLGARTRDIVRLLVWQFSRPVLIANAIAWPVAWWLMRDWLNRFDVRIGLGPTPFLLAGGLALGIAIATIASHAFRVARANPILALRYE